MNLDIKIPAINEIGYPKNQKELILNKLDLIENNFGSIITTVSTVTNVPREIIKSVIFIESSGNKNIESFICPKVKAEQCPVGLMQISPQTATNVIYKENINKRLSEPEKQLCYKWIGKAKVDCILSMQYMNQKKKCNGNTGVSFTKTDLKNPQINILLGTLLFGQYMDKYTENGKVRLDKAIIAYNKSTKTADKAGASIQEAMAILPKETSQYITKFLGVGGTMDLLV